MCIHAYTNTHVYMHVYVFVFIFNCRIYFNVCPAVELVLVANQPPQPAFPCNMHMYVCMCVYALPLKSTTADGNGLFGCFVCSFESVTYL